ncbi:unnamed protein product [Staurois parvus]|uniref:Uncharacterized protein n=1 Tax=Staurois parvus TaxID=386267 RepID=A0ABN9CG37_9NEOB|nr:unnamed protein product [Staurois parvus]
MAGRWQCRVGWLFINGLPETCLCRRSLEARSTAIRCPLTQRNTDHCTGPLCEVLIM